MDILLSMLANSAAKKIDEKRWGHTPYSMERNAESSESVQNYALYRYIMKNAMFYPKEWLDNGYGAKVVVKIKLHNDEATLIGIEVLDKTDGLDHMAIIHAVEKTFHRAKNDFPAAAIEHDEGQADEATLELPLEWRVMRDYRAAQIHTRRLLLRDCLLYLIAETAFQQICLRFIALGRES